MGKVERKGRDGADKLTVHTSYSVPTLPRSGPHKFNVACLLKDHAPHAPRDVASDLPCIKLSDQLWLTSTFKSEIASPADVAFRSRGRYNSGNK